jgi:hypothetical protein
MQERINKPRVFLSHSNIDKPFIERAAADLRRCHIDYWLDTEEIRDGRSWLKVIFEDGIPTCDAVIVYLTENSIKSKMVAKELDATLVEELTGSGIVVLPYVSEAILRGRLRADIRTLQCREWNDANYSEMLPSVVAEIWRSYLERTVNAAILREKNRRLELELDLNRMREKYEGTVFTPSEEREFNYLRQKLDRNIKSRFTLVKGGQNEKSSKKIGYAVYKVNLLSAYYNLIEQGRFRFRRSSIELFLIGRINQAQPPLNDTDLEIDYQEGIKDNLLLELHTYGLVRMVEADQFQRQDHVYELSDKMYRFKYWLDYNNLAVSDVSFEFIEVIED